MKQMASRPNRNKGQAIQVLGPQSSPECISVVIMCQVVYISLEALHTCTQNSIPSY